MKCCDFERFIAYTYLLGNPMTTKNFVQYPACSDVNLLAQRGLVKIVFREASTSELQVSIADCRTNTLVYKEDGTPLLGNQVKINTPSRIIFNAEVGGYVIYGYLPNETEEPEPTRALTVATMAPKKESGK